MVIQSAASLIGQMSSHTSAQEMYEAPVHRKGARSVQAGADTAPERMDRVELSANAPKPLDAGQMARANQLAERIANGESLKPRDMTELRNDRVFVAMVTLEALRLARPGMRVQWPGGFPRPNQAEMEEAYRRIAQRPRNLETVNDSEQIVERRRELLAHHRNTDFAELEDAFDTISV